MSEYQLNMSDTQRQQSKTQISDSDSIININYLRSGVIEPEIKDNNKTNTEINEINNKKKSLSSSYKFNIDQQYSNAVKDIIADSNYGKVVKNQKPH